MQALVTISKKWHKPEITTTVWQHGESEDGTYVVIRMGMEDFIKALKTELGDGSDKIDKAIQAICTGMKYEWLKHPL